MNANRLLSHFEKISDAPDAVDRLRRFILDLAVRGKLVEQDPGDASAEQLLGSRAVAAEPGQAPFPLPTGWAWTTLARIGESFGGGTPSKANSAYWQGDIPWVTPKDMKVCEITDAQDHISEAGVEKSSARLIPAGAVLMVVRGMILAHSFPSAINRRPVTINQDMKAVVPFQAEMSQMLLLLMQGMKPQILALVKHSTHGTCKLLTDELFALLLPLPPLAEQHRIVEKVDELMKLCDRLEASQVERESQRDRLVVASLNKLGQPTDPDEFKKDAGFQLSNLSRLSTKTEHIKELRKAILNLAVRGKLVPQDERAAQAVGSTEHRASIELPQGWRWVRIADLLDGDSQNGYSKKPDDDPAGIPILRISAATVRSDRIIAEEEYKLIGGVSQKQRDQFQLVPGDLLACRFNGNKSFVGRMAEYRGSHGKAFIYPDKLIRLRLQPSLAIPALLRHFGESAMMRLEIESFCATTVGNWGISATNLKSVHVPLPPLAEQKRIVAKVDALMLICDQLETQIESQQKGRRQLLDALLHEALEGEG
jgi:type I restriction enzyme, S subunit